MSERHSSCTVHPTLVFFAVALLVLITASVFGQSSLNNTRHTVQKSDDEIRRQVLATDDRRSEALRRGEAASLRQIYADDYTLVTPAGRIYTKTDQINDLRRAQLRYVKIDVSERTVRVYGDVVVILSREKTDIVRDGQQVGGDIRVTRVYKRFGSEWRVIATQATAIAP
jgi:ketosteroid isomerase-like protein